METSETAFSPPKRLLTFLISSRDMKIKTQILRG
jgi:hypothetical protein